MQAFIWRESERHEKVGGAVSCFRVRTFLIACVAGVETGSG